MLKVNEYGERQAKGNEKNLCFKGWETLVSIFQSRYQFRLQDIPATSHLVGWDLSILYPAADGTFLAPEHSGNVRYRINGVRSIHYAVADGRGILILFSFLPRFVAEEAFGQFFFYWCSIKLFFRSYLFNSE